MPAHPLLEKQNVLHAKASSLLEEVLFPILKKYGDVSVGGSYAYKLLNHPDIDIDIVNEDCSKELFAALCAELISLEYTSKFASTDRVHYPHIHQGKRPTGYWVAPTIHFDDTLWKMDIWLQKPEWHTGDTNRYELTNYSRRVTTKHASRSSHSNKNLLKRNSMELVTSLCRLMYMRAYLEVQ
jgi:hypothetical protein